MSPCVFKNMRKVQHEKKESSFSGQVHSNKIWVEVYLDDKRFHIKIASMLSVTVNKYVIMILIFY